jgi:hypothetical protein
MNLAGIKVNKDEFVARMKKRFGERQEEGTEGGSQLSSLRHQMLHCPMADA